MSQFCPLLPILVEACHNLHTLISPKKGMSSSVYTHSKSELVLTNRIDGDISGSRTGKSYGDGWVLLPQLNCLDQLTIYHESTDDVMERLTRFSKACSFQVLAHLEAWASLMDISCSILCLRIFSCFSPFFGKNVKSIMWNESYAK